MSERSISPWALVGCALALFAFVGVVFSVFQLILAPGEGEKLAIDVTMAVQGIGSLLAIALTVALVRRVGPALGIRWRGRHGVGFHILGAYALMMFVWFPVSFLLYPLVLDALGAKFEAQEHLAFFADPSGWIWVMLVVICVIGPIFEEIVFRGFLQTGLRRLTGPWVALALTSVLFGLMHGLVIAFPLALMGAFFGYLRERDDGLFAPMAAHMLHNSVTVGLTMFCPELLQEAFDR